MLRNPVMFVVLIGARSRPCVLVRDVAAGAGDVGFTLQLALWLWFTVLFANFAEAMAEGRGKAQADALRGTRTHDPGQAPGATRQPPDFTRCVAAELRRGDLVLVQAGDLIPADGEVVEGVASVDESAITGESAPVIRESGGDRSAVTGGTKVLSDWLVIRITANPGETFLDRMIALVEGAERQKTPNEIALTILLVGPDDRLPVRRGDAAAVRDLQRRRRDRPGAGRAARLPHPHHDRRPALGHRHRGHGPADPAQRDRDERPRGRGGGRRQHAAARQDRHDHARQPAGGRSSCRCRGVTVEELADRAQLASLPDETPEGRSIVVLAKEKFGLRARAARRGRRATRRCTVRAVLRRDPDERGQPGRRCSSARARPTPSRRWVAGAAGPMPPELDAGGRDASPAQGGTPLVVAERENGGSRVLGAIYLKDVVKGGMKERFDQLRAMGIRTVMITGDNPLTAAAIAAEAGVDDFLAEATPEDKMELIRREQAGGRLVAMTGDGTNDAPALAQADVGVAMNTGTQAAQGGRQHGRPRLQSHQAHRGRRDREAAADDARLAHHVLDRQRRGQVLRHHPGDVRRDLPGAAGAQHHAAALAAVGHPRSVIFNALIIIALIPLALRGVTLPARAGARHPAPQSADLRRRRAHRAVRRHQADRRAARRPRPGLTMLKHQLRPAIVADARAAA